jgi:hypothetical protein
VAITAGFTEWFAAAPGSAIGTNGSSAVCTLRNGRLTAGNADGTATWDVLNLAGGCILNQQGNDELQGVYFFAYSNKLNLLLAQLVCAFRLSEQTGMFHEGCGGVNALVCRFGVRLHGWRLRFSTVFPFPELLDRP